MSLPFSNNTIQVYRYDTFSYTLTHPTAYSLQLGTVTTSLVPFVTNNGSNVTFSATVFPAGISSNELFVVNAYDFGGSLLGTSSNRVVIGAGRFIDASGNSLTNTAYTFYKNEAITPIRFQCFFPLLGTPTTSPSLPVGLSFVQVASNAYDLSGIPSFQVPSSNYLVIGKGDGGKIVTASNVNLTVNAERLLLDVSGSSIVSPIFIGQSITPRVVTSRTSGVQYRWSGLPDGFVFTDISNVPKTSPFTATDSSSTLILRGAPTSNAALSLIPSGQTTLTLGATRSGISSSTAFSFQFGETILFDTPNLCNLYVNLPVPSSVSSNNFRAQSYFSTQSITNIYSPNLVSDLSLSFTGGRAYLTGTPTIPSLGTYTIRAVSSSSLTQDISATLSIDYDTLTFTVVPIDTCFNFIVSRSLDLAKTGYYPSNIFFKAVAGSGCNVTYTAPQLADTGISLSNSNGGVVLTGIPEVPLPLTTLDILADVLDTSTTTFTNTTFAILQDDLSFTTFSNLRFLQNRAITPFQISATTLSGRNVTSYVGVNMPEGIQISAAGIVSGTPITNTNRLDSSFTIIATTGFSTDFESYTYSILEDAIAFTPISNQQLTIGQPIQPISLQAYSYSGKPVSNLQFVNLDASYGLTLTSSSNTGLLTGTLTNTYMPLLSNVVFGIQGTVGSFTDTERFVLTTSSNPSSFLRLVSINQYNNNTYSYYRATDYLTNPWTLGNEFLIDTAEDRIPIGIGYTDIQVRYPRLEGYTQSSNLFVMATNRAYPKLSSNGTTLTSLTGLSTDFDRRLYQVTYDICTNCWYGIGYVNSNTTTDDQVYLYTGGSNAADWDLYPRQALGIQPRYGMTRTGYGYSNGYIGGTCLRAKDGILMAGGRTMLRRENGVWGAVSGQFQAEVDCYNLDGPVWVAGGSDLYNHEDVSSGFTRGTITLKYSTDKGISWYPATGGFNHTCFEIEYGCNQWLSRGMSYSNGEYYQEYRYSSNGSNWSLLDLGFSAPFRTFDAYTQWLGARFYNPPGKIAFDGMSWSLYACRINPYTSNNVLNRITYFMDVYQHDKAGSLASNWSNIALPIEDNIVFKYVQGSVIGGYIGPIASAVFPNISQTTSTLSTLEGKAIFKDPRV